MQMSCIEHMVAGAVAGIGEHIAMYPVDTVKTRIQAASSGQVSTGMSHLIRDIFRAEGVRGLYRGVSAVFLGAGPAHALYFATYEAAKDAYGGNRAGHHPLATALAGATATVVNDGCMTPWDVVKQRMQMAKTPFSSVWACAAETWQRGGLRAFYRSYWTTLVMNVPHTALQFPLYESTKKLLSGASSGDLEADGLREQLVAGGVAGATAAAATTPLDVVKTRLQLEGFRGGARYASGGVLNVARQIVAAEGPAALWRGTLPRVLFHAPSAAVCWGIYESAKRLLAV
ncbi:hypothetical protein H632_c1328p1 [Helicosporidium sp. ATCC 50920]|nr:hypothetical protein H632_c1328p1 [Helicosporidium sp. ATCC 50920]|eukprot:KDD74418.1 hypothetical protein H632_c1328p1 [Helicosporidium sp. ATCC 50920]